VSLMVLKLTHQKMQCVGIVSEMKKGVYKRNVICYISSINKGETLMKNFNGLFLSFVLITIMMVGIPILGAAIAWPENCEQSIIIPCLGLE